MQDVSPDGCPSLSPGVEASDCRTQACASGARRRLLFFCAPRQLGRLFRLGFRAFVAIRPSVNQLSHLPATAEHGLVKTAVTGRGTTLR